MIVIESAEAKDLASLTELEEVVFAPGWTSKQLADGLDTPSCLVLVARVDTRLIGYVNYRSVLDEAELLRLAVRSEYRRQGVAVAMVAEGHRRLAAQGVLNCHLEVRADNLGALAFYKRQGFKESGRRWRYYPDGEDAVIMTSSLQQGIRAHS